MYVLVACEESQRVCIAFRQRGHCAFSCDIQEPSGNHPQWHILSDVRSLLGNMPVHFRTMDNALHTVERWDLIIAHPPCTYLTNASAVRMRVNGKIVKERYEKMLEARSFFLFLMNVSCDKICIENPVPMKLANLPPYSQIIEPWMFGHPYTKQTCLWLKGLMHLMPAEIVTEGITPWVNGGNKDAHGNYIRVQGRRERDSKNRAKTFEGVAKAMAQQWG